MIVEVATAGVTMRYFLVAGACIVLIIGGMSALVSWRKLSLGQKAFLGGAMSAQLYIASALLDAIDAQLEFKWRLLALAFSEVSYFVYLLEPIGLRKARRGRPMFAGDDD